eukprot:c11989_g2_i2.p1 GENE.c11989_g2_i2~~c11989_g2_i2.p1  ORF type:complete len:260 (+),score=80.30 c11989_g2_i2:31-780(+)
MAVNVTDVQVLDNPTCFLNPFQFEISFECLAPLQEDLEWKVIYVGSAEDDKCDQVLDSVQVGPLQSGFMKFVFQVDPPDPSKIPVADLLEVTVVLLTCSYRGKEFIRVGYYVANEYTDPELKEIIPASPVLEKIQRHILADQPRVTKWQIPWDEEPSSAATLSSAVTAASSSSSHFAPTSNITTSNNNIININDDHLSSSNINISITTSTMTATPSTPNNGLLDDGDTMYSIGDTPQHPPHHSSTPMEM